jgi:hypothetical protein
MNLRRTLLWTLFWTSLAVSLPAALSAGTVITLKEQSPRGPSDHKVYMDGGKLRFESVVGGRSHVILYHSANGSFQVLDPAKKTWFEMPAGASAASQQAAATKKVMERKDLTPARKQMILDNMKANSRHGLYGGPPTPAQYKKVASGVTMNGYTADEYEVTLGGTKTREVWLADPKSLGIDPADVEAFKSMAERLGASSAGRPSGFGLETGAPRGVPVRTVRYVNGQPSITTDLSAISHEDVAVALFEVPKDYKQTTPGAPAAH